MPVLQAEAPAQARRGMGLKGRSYYQRHLAFGQGLRRTLEVLEGARLAS